MPEVSKAHGVHDIGGELAISSHTSKCLIANDVKDETDTTTTQCRIKEKI